MHKKFRERLKMQNIEYKPNWEAVHNFHHDERTRLENAIKDLVKTITSETDPSELEKLQKERNYHHETCLRCLDTYQHKTVQHYVRWALENFGTLSDILKQDYASHISLDHCQTIEQARAIISQLHELEAKDEFLNRDSGGKPCPAGKPDGFDIFTRTDTNNLTTQWMNFKVVSNFGTGDEYDFILLTSVDTRENEKHVCFFGDGDRTRDAMLIFPHIGQLAYQFIEQDLGKDFEEFEKSNVKAKNGFIASLFSKKPKDFPVYHFYTHTFMSSGFPREDFMKHDLEYHREGTYNPRSRYYGDFRRVKMQPFDCMPQYLKAGVDHHIGFEGISLKE